MPNPDELDPMSVYGAHLPPIYANQFHVSVIGGVMRVVFGEVIVGGGQTLYPHVVISMTPERATELSALILRVIQQSAAAAAAAAETSPKEQSTGSNSV